MKFKLTACCLTAVCLLGYSNNTTAADETENNPCEPLLKDGLYNHYKFSRSDSFDEDFKNYLASDTFQSDLKDGKWGASITVPIDDVPVSLGANSSDHEIHQFQQTIRNNQHFHISQNGWQSIASSVPNAELSHEYKECVLGIFNRPGFHVTADEGSDYAYFHISYIKLNSHDPFPIVKKIEVQNGTDISTGLEIEESIKDSNYIKCKRDPKKDVVLFLQTDSGVVIQKVPAKPLRTVSNDMPIGTIVASYLKPDQFYEATKANGDSLSFIRDSSLWSPADGRNVAGSLFAKYSGQDFAPDLRGMFLRGLNVMEAQPSIPLDASKKDPDDRSVGSYQPDAVGPHTHPIKIFNASGGPNNGPEILCGHYPDTPQTNLTAVKSPEGTVETRPKNIAVYYYIRIN